MSDPRASEPAPRRRRPARRWLVPPAIALVGVALILATSGTIEIVGAGVIGVAAVVAISLAFLEVGYSEDRARERGE